MVCRVPERGAAGAGSSVGHLAPFL